VHLGRRQPRPGRDVVGGVPGGRHGPPGLRHLHGEVRLVLLQLALAPDHDPSGAPELAADDGVGPAGLLAQLARGRLARRLAGVDAAARGRPVDAHRRRVVVAQQQHPAVGVAHDDARRLPPLHGPASVEVVAQLLRPGRVAELGERLALDLADPLAGQAELAADLVERARAGRRPGRSAS
jgi:hypothetical protein